MPLRDCPAACTALAGDIEGVGGGDSVHYELTLNGLESQHVLPSALLRSDLAFLLLAASARVAAASCFCFSRISFSRLLRAAAPRSFVPFLLVAIFPVGSGERLFLDEVSEWLDPVRWRLVLGLRLLLSANILLSLNTCLLFTVFPSALAECILCLTLFDSSS